MYFLKCLMLKSFAIYDSSKHLMVTFSFKKRPYFSRLRISGMAFKGLKTLVLESILK